MLGKQDGKNTFFDDYIFRNILPKEHILLDIKREIDFSFVNEELKDLYNPNNGRPSYSPEVLFRILFLEFYYNLSDVEVVKQCQVNLLFRYFANLSIEEPIPDDTTLVVFRKRCGNERFERLFNRIVEKCKSVNLLKERLKIVDATSIEADVAVPNTVNLLRQGRRVIIRKILKENLEKGENFESEENILEFSDYYSKERLHEKPNEDELKSEILKTKEFVKKVKGKYNEEVEELLSLIETVYDPQSTSPKAVSFIDTDAKHGVKSPKRMFSGYKAHISMDESGIVTSINVLHGNQSESSDLLSLMEKDRINGINGKAVVADALYDSAFNRESIHKIGMKAYIPQRRKSIDSKGFRYDSKEDLVSCINNNIARRGKCNQNSGRLYNFDFETCKKCETKCKAYKEDRARIFISNDLKLKLKDDDEFYKEALEKRKAVERKFGEAKKWHGLRRARYRGKWRVALQVFMTFIVINVKKMIKLIKKGVEQISLNLKSKNNALSLSLSLSSG